MQRSDMLRSSGSLLRFRRPVLYSGGGCDRFGETGPNFPPAQAGSWFLQVLVGCSSASRYSRSSSFLFIASGVSEGILPSGGSTTREVRRPVGFTDWNTALYAPAT